MTDLDYLRACIAEARAAERDGEVPIGAVLTLNGEIVARGQNLSCATAIPPPTPRSSPSAQPPAPRQLSPARGCTLYVTLEPCAMCAGAILHARVTRLVYAAPDPKAGACGSVLSVLNHPQLNHQVELSSGLLAGEAGEILTAFFRARR